MLIRNEDLFVEQAIKNVLSFCDRLIVVDHCSKDQTQNIVRRLLAVYSNIEFHQILNPSESHDFISEYAGTNTWIFGVDGDEIYDPERLTSFRRKLEQGKFSQWWMIFGNVMNCIEIIQDNKLALGYLSPPSRSMTKLYNFNAIESWKGDVTERLHGGSPVFRKGYGATMRCSLQNESTWENAEFRCLHVCFMKRSSLDRKNSNHLWLRPNIADIEQQRKKYAVSFAVASILCRFLYKESRWKKEKYMRGPLVSKDVKSFFCE